MSRPGFASVFALLAGAGACATNATPPASSAATASAPEPPYSCALRPLATLGPDFSVRQRVEASSHGHGGSFDAVLQKKGDTLVLVGLVAGIRAFILKQEGERISFEQSLGPKMPFPPEYAIIDVHRVYWKRIPRAADAPASGTAEGDLDGERVREVWSNGNLVERRFSRPGEREGFVKVDYGPGCAATVCQPTWVRIENEWFGYTVRIENMEFSLL